MGGNRIGGLKVAAKNIQKDPLHYKKIGAKGGLAGAGPDYRLGGSKPSGFAAMSAEQRRINGSKGGKISKRPKPAIKKLSDLQRYESQYGETAIQSNPAML